MLTNYSQPLSATEDGQCKNAIRMVADALKTLGFTDDNAAITPLYTDTFAYSLRMRRSSDSRNIKLFVQGSYANNTNVRTESDVDVAVIQEETFLAGVSEGFCISTKWSRLRIYSCASGGKDF